MFFIMALKRYILIDAFWKLVNKQLGVMISPILYPELSFSLHSILLCQRSFYKIFVKFRNSKKNVLKVVLIIVNINKDENK